MDKQEPITEIPPEVALTLCQQIASENRGKWYTFNGMWCWGCVRFSGPVTNRCYANASGQRGCAQVNARYDRQLADAGSR